MSKQENNQEEGMIKPSFDGRQHFYKTLNKYQEMLGAARYANNYVIMEQSLRGFLTMVYPYIKNPDEIKVKLDIVKKFCQPKFIRKFPVYIEELLDQASFLLFEASI